MKDFQNVIKLLNENNVEYKISTYENYLDISINEFLYITFNVENNCNAIFYNEDTYNIDQLDEILKL